MIRFAPPIAIALAAALISACGPAPPAPAKPAPAAPTAGGAPDAGYLAPPELVGAARLEQRLVLTGNAAPGASVRLASPDGGGGAVVADAKGGWSIAVPAPGSEPNMYALIAQVGPRVVRAEGAVLALPRPGPPAVLARAGVSVLPLEGPITGLRITALDYDGGGGAAVAGVGPAGARVRLKIDGMEAGLDQADARGRFAVLGANLPLKAGDRRVEVEITGARAEASAHVSTAAPLGASAFRAVREAGGWRVDWARAGGGVQSTLVFDQAVGTGS